ncbi:unnamed protein product [Closterium sp. Yama58-4]|nr:unnamed protein product [Closterium sp. Yama58-4]
MDLVGIVAELEVATSSRQPDFLAASIVCLPVSACRSQLRCAFELIFSSSSAMATVAAPSTSLRCSLLSSQGKAVAGRQLAVVSARPAAAFSKKAALVARASAEEKPSLAASIATAAATAICGACVAVSLATAAPAIAAPSPSQVRLPPLSNDPGRCERAFVGNTIGQANGVSDKVLDLRQCDFSGDKENLKGKTLSSALMSGAKFDNADLTETVMSKAYAVGASFRGADFSNSVLDRVLFNEADLTGASFRNAVLSGSTFNDANLTDTVFEDALIGYVDVQKLCRNKTLGEFTRLELGCK